MDVISIQIYGKYYQSSILSAWQSPSAATHYASVDCMDPKFIWVCPAFMLNLWSQFRQNVLHKKPLGGWAQAKITVF